MTMARSIAVTDASGHSEARDLARDPVANMTFRRAGVHAAPFTLETGRAA